MKFEELDLSPALLKAIAAQGYTSPTPIQERAIPPVLDGEDLVAVAQTGTGKTAAFALPTLQWLSENPLQLKRGERRPVRCLVLSPTRELASQIDQSFKDYGVGTGLRSCVIFGGVSQLPQERELKSGVDILVATPGRLLDLMGQKLVDFRDVEVVVLDEADRMLDMGFIKDVRRILEALPEERQTLLFSATMPEEIDALAKRFLVDPVRIEVTPPATTVEKIDQSIYFVDKGNKTKLLLWLLEDPEVTRTLVFSRTKHGANRIAASLDAAGIAAAAIHGNKSQGARERALEGFKAGRVRVLVATDIAARGIDVEGVSHVVQVDLPEVPEQYVHRIGRTARAGAAGIAWAFCSPDERALLTDIERTTRQSIPVVDNHPFPSTGVAAPASARSPSGRQGGRPGRSEGRAGGRAGGQRGGRGRGGGGGGGGRSAGGRRRG